MRPPTHPKICTARFGLRESVITMYQLQTFTTPDGTAMVVLPAADFERLLAKADELGDLVQA